MENLFHLLMQRIRKTRGVGAFEIYDYEKIGSIVTIERQVMEMTFEGRKIRVTLESMG